MFFKIFPRPADSVPPVSMEGMEESFLPRASRAESLLILSGIQDFEWGGLTWRSDWVQRRMIR